MEPRKRLPDSYGGASGVALLHRRSCYALEGYAMAEWGGRLGQIPKLRAERNYPAMNLEFVRRHCLSLPHARENLQWGETLCFKVGGRLFALADLSASPQSLTLKCSPERFAELLEVEGISLARYVGRYKWVTLESPDVLRPDELEDVIRQSYDLVVAKLPKRKRSAAAKHGLRRPRK